MTAPDLERSVTDEKHEQVQREYLAQDETPEIIENKKKEDALRRKLDCFVAPVMMMLMLISYLDRGNIGFAATQGMTTDIGLKGSELNVRHGPSRCPENGQTNENIDRCIGVLHLLHSRRSTCIRLLRVCTSDSK